MANRRPRAWHLLVIPASFLLLSTVKLYSYLRQRSDIWWTPIHLAVPLPQSRDRVEVYVRGSPLLTLVGGGRMRLTGDSVPVRTPEVVVRFNNWDRVRAERIPSLMLTSATAGASAVLLLFWLINPRFGRIPQEV